MGLAPAKQFAEELLADANAELAPFAGRASRLAQLADFIVHRDR
jgi:farnesyl diphosphate synthase